MINSTVYVEKLSTEKLSNWSKAMAGKWQSWDSNPSASDIKVHLFGLLSATQSNSLDDSGGILLCP